MRVKPGTTHDLYEEWGVTGATLGVRLDDNQGAISVARVTGFVEYPAGSGIYYLDPGNPEVQSYTTLVYTNLLRNYDVDGIHLDQIRYYEGDALRWGYNPASVARFNQRFGLDPASQPAPRPIVSNSDTGCGSVRTSMPRSRTDWGSASSRCATFHLAYEPA